MYNKCFVACLDILGFKKIIENQDATIVNESLSQLKEFSNILTGARLHKPNPKIHSLLISDTLLLFSEVDNEKSFKYVTGNIAETICAGMGFSITNIRPMRFRGAISWGDFYYDEAENFFFGPAYNEAVEWEKKQEWIGAILTPSCATFVQQKGYDQSQFVEYEAPIKEIIKEGAKCETIINPTRCLCVNWTTGFACENVRYDEINHSLYNSTEEIRNKLENTHEFYKYCRTKA